MREFYVTRGKNQGVHYIFDSTTEAIEYLKDRLNHLNINNQDLSDPLSAFKFWHQFGEYQSGDWVKSDDGRVIQCLKYVELVSKNRRTGQPLKHKDGRLNTIYICKTAVGNWSKRTRSDGGLTSRRMDLDYFLAIHSSSRGSITHGRVLGGRYMNDKKRLFAFYCVVIGNPVRAYERAYPDKCVTHIQRTKMIQKAFFLLTQQEVLKEVQKYMSLADFRIRLKEALKAVEIDEERLAQEYVSGLESAKKGSQNHRQFIELGIQMLKYLESLDNQLETTRPTVLQLPDPSTSNPEEAIYLPEETKPETQQEQDYGFTGE